MHYLLVHGRLSAGSVVTPMLLLLLLRFVCVCFYLSLMTNNLASLLPLMNFVMCYRLKVDIFLL